MTLRKCGGWWHRQDVGGLEMRDPLLFGGIFTWGWAKFSWKQTPFHLLRKASLPDLQEDFEARTCREMGHLGSHRLRQAQALLDHPRPSSCPVSRKPLGLCVLLGAALGVMSPLLQEVSGF